MMTIDESGLFAETNTAMPYVGRTAVNLYSCLQD